MIRETDVPAAPLVTVIRTGVGRRVPYGYIRVGAGIAISSVLRAYNVGAASLLRQADLPIDLFANPDHALPFRDYCRFISLCVEATRRDDFGLLICEKVGASNLGLVGLLLQQAPDVRAALNDLVRYLHHIDRGAVPFMSVGGRMVTLGYAISEPDMPAADHVADGALAVGRNIMHGLCGPNWAPLEVTLSRKRPASATRHERFYGAPVRFGAERNAMFFREGWLNTPIQTAEPILRRMLQEQVDLLEAEEAGNVTERVRRLLRTSLLTSSASLGDLSDRLQIHRRTLARRLDTEGTSFKRISDEVHYDVARHLLANTAMSVTDVSLALHYSEASAFTRAFRGWTGLTPSEWRGLHLRS